MKCYTKLLLKYFYNLHILLAKNKYIYKLKKDIYKKKYNRIALICITRIHPYRRSYPDLKCTKTLFRKNYEVFKTGIFNVLYLEHKIN